ncbi:hypothetical protein QBC38DRAFT_459019, partial [Podospora fimiseda]
MSKGTNFTEYIPIPVQKSAILKGRGETWGEWFSQYKRHVKSRDLWEYLNPDAPTIYGLLGPAGEFKVTEDMVKIQLKAEKQQVFEEALKTWEALPTEQKVTTPRPTLGVPTEKEISDQYIAKVKTWKESSEKILDDQQVTNYNQISNWVNLSVDRALYDRACDAYESTPGGPTVQMIVKFLAKECAVTEHEREDNIRKRYRDHLALAIQRGTDRDAWLETYKGLYNKAMQHRIPEVQGSIGSSDFLEVLRAQYAPEWARSQLMAQATKATLGEKLTSLDDLIKIFSTLVAEENRLTSSGGRNATILT